MEKSGKLREEAFADVLIQKGSTILKHTVYFFAGFILSGAQLLSLKVPLCTGLAAACTGTELIFSALGGLCGAFLRLSGAELINTAVPLAGTAIMIFSLEKIAVKKNRRFIVSCGVFLLCCICAAAVMFSSQASAGGFMLIICTSLLCAASVTFFSGTVNCINRKQSPYMLDNHTFVCIIASLCSLLLGSCEISLMGFRPARFFGCFVILCAAFLFSRSGGSIAGISIGGCIAVSGTSVALSLCYGICGLLSGIFSRFGQMVCALVFTAAAGIAALLDGSREGLCVFAEAAAAAFIFAAIPKPRFSRLRSNILNPKAKRIESEFGAAGKRLLDVSQALGSVSDCVSSVSKGIDALSPANDILVCMRVKERVCSQCRLKDTFCPEDGEFAEILQKLSQGESIKAEDFSVNFNAKCPSVIRIAEAFNKVYASRSAVNMLQASSARNRELACRQFEWTAELLHELSQELGKEVQTLFNKEKSAARVLCDFGFEVINVSCTQPPSGALKLVCTVKEIPSRTSLSELTSSLSTELEAQLNPPEIKETQEGKKLIFLRKELFKIRLGSATASCGNQRLCGDYFECFRTDSKAYIILSDGMGTGGRAAIDSTMTVELFSRLLRSGISPDCALSITNSALTVKSDDESLSTLDVAEIDLFDGSTVIYKAGAAPSFFTFSGKVRTVEMPSTPLGILCNVKFGKYTLKLRGGDTLMMVSDGILGCGNLWLKDEIKAFGGGRDATDFSQDVLDSARRRCGGKFDDMTVITAVAEEL